MRILVLGATGVLRPAARSLAARRHTVYAGSRTPDTDSVAGLVSVPVDLTDAAHATGVLRALPSLGAALVYAPFGCDGLGALLAELVDGPVVELLPSAHADPAVNPVADPSATLACGVPLLLGWTTDVAGRGTRWHTPEEISHAALATLADGRPRLLGRVRPWSQRPA